MSHAVTTGNKWQDIKVAAKSGGGQSGLKSGGGQQW